MSLHASTSSLDDGPMALAAGFDATVRFVCDGLHPPSSCPTRGSVLTTANGLAQRVQKPRAIRLRRGGASLVRLAREDASA